MDDSVREDALYFVKVIADAVDTLKYGRKYAADKHEGVRSFRSKSISYSAIAGQLRRINDAMVGARLLGIIPEDVAKFSGSELSDFAQRIRAYLSIEAPQKIEETIMYALRERRVPQEFLTQASTDIMYIVRDMEDGVWK